MQGQHRGTSAPVVGQRAGERVLLETLQQDQRIGPRPRRGERTPQHVGGVGGRARPGQSQRGQQGLPLQGLLGGCDRFAQTLGPGQALFGRYRSGQRGQLTRGLHQTCHHDRAQRCIGAPLGHAVHERGRDQAVARHVHAQIGRARQERLQRGGPVAAGFKTGRKTAGVRLRPGAPPGFHELGVGHQHQGAIGLGLAPGHGRFDARDHRIPTQRRRVWCGLGAERGSGPAHGGVTGFWEQAGRRHGSGVSVTMERITPLGVCVVPTLLRCACPNFNLPVQRS